MKRKNYFDKFTLNVLNLTKKILNLNNPNNQTAKILVRVELLVSLQF